MAQLKGKPDNAGGPIVPKQTGSLAALPIPSLPPYEPAAVAMDFGVTGLVVYSNTNGVALVNPRNHTISPIMLNAYDNTIDPETGYAIGGLLGSEGGGRFDVAMTSDGRQALISNFGDSKVFFVDLSSGTPVVSGMVQIDFFAEDIAIDPTNTWALVTDGGFSPGIAVIHIPTRTWIPAGVDGDTGDPYSWRMVIDQGEDLEDPEDDTLGYSQGVAIAADGRTVLTPDYFDGSVHVCLFDPLTGGLTYQQTVKLWKYGTDETAIWPLLYRPVNVSISPDGRTVIAVNAQRSTYPSDPTPDAIFEGCNLAVFTIDAPGHITRQPDVVFSNRIDGGQSLVFSADGRRAYLHTIYRDDEPDPPDEDVYWEYSEIQILAVNGPGMVSHIGSMRSPTVRGTSQLFGVDTMAVTADGNFLYVTNPTLSGASPVIDVFNLSTQSHFKQIGTPVHYPDPVSLGNFIEWVLPVGIAFPATPPNEPPVAVIAVNKSELILDINETATFSGSASYDPEESPLNYTWSLISAPANTSATLTPSGKTAVLKPDPNVEGAYQVGLVVNDGVLDSKMAVAFTTAKFYPVLAPASVALQRLENNYIFYKEYVNRLTWAVNTGNKSTLANYEIYRKTKGAGDGTYTLLATLAPTIFTYDDKGLAKDQLCTYRITAVNTRGKKSDPVVVGN